MNITPRAQRYINWMSQLNEIGKANHRIYLRTKFTWRAFLKDLSPKQYIASLGAAE